MSFFKKYASFALREEEVKNKVAELLKDASKYETLENYKSIFSLIDLTSLNSSNTSKSIECFIDQLNSYSKNFPNYEPVAAICVYPPFISQIKATLRSETGVKVASVAASFPSSQTYLEVKKKECELALLDGADELDIVISLKHFLEKNYQKAFEEIRAIKTLCGNKHLKVILETGVLKSPGQIYDASLLAMEAGADFIKTSTGKLEPAATLEAVYVMCEAIHEFNKVNGKLIGIKAAGGISTGEDAVKYLVLVKKMLGDGYIRRELFRFGASKLANDVLGKMEGSLVNYFGEKFPKEEGVGEKKNNKDKSGAANKEKTTRSFSKETEKTVKIEVEISKKIKKSKKPEEKNNKGLLNLAKKREIKVENNKKNVKTAVGNSKKNKKK